MVSGVVAPLAVATQWTEIKARDPISGRNVVAHEIVAYGSYIYLWDSKSDQVFWPYTDDNYLWLSPHSGYAAFGNDFESLAAEAKPRVSEWLKANYDRRNLPRTRIERLHWVERIYALRRMDDDFWCHFYRLMAYELRENEPESLSYVRKALPLIEGKISSSSKPLERIEALYLLGEYNRRLHRYELARGYFARVKSSLYVDDDGTERTGNPYFVALAAERAAMIPQPSPNNALEQARDE